MSTLRWTSGTPTLDLDMRAHHLIMALTLSDDYFSFIVCMHLQSSRLKLVTTGT